MKNSSIQKRLTSNTSGAKKYLISLPDGETVESVLLPCKHGYTVCVSSQVGCKRGCSFCATGKSGLIRNLSTEEMVFQMDSIQQMEKIGITCVVLMGMGEPFDNYENVLQFINLITLPSTFNIPLHRIKISTSGVVDKIYKLAEQGKEITLAISLHAPNDSIRNRLMRINQHWNIDELLKACDYYSKKTNTRILIEYIMIDSINDRVQNAYELASRLKEINCTVDLIPANDIGTGEFFRSSDSQIRLFLSVLQSHGIDVSVRRTIGYDIAAACGQLRATSILH